eukprot:Rhum_TRINITY_DN14357_c3_g1::Rhum_TRINITY_DN14357_c3_g1_i1::g.84077::m.84077
MLLRRRRRPDRRRCRSVLRRCRRRPQHKRGRGRALRGWNDAVGCRRRRRGRGSRTGGSSPRRRSGLPLHLRCGGGGGGGGGAVLCRGGRGRRRRRRSGSKHVLLHNRIVQADLVAFVVVQQRLHLTDLLRVVPPVQILDLLLPHRPLPPPLLGHKQLRFARRFGRAAVRRSLSRTRRRRLQRRCTDAHVRQRTARSRRVRALRQAHEEGSLRRVRVGHGGARHGGVCRGCSCVGRGRKRRRILLRLLHAPRRHQRVGDCVGVVLPVAACRGRGSQRRVVLRRRGRSRSGSRLCCHCLLRFRLSRSGSRLLLSSGGRRRCCGGCTGRFFLRGRLGSRLGRRQSVGRSGFRSFLLFLCLGRGCGRRGRLRRGCGGCLSLGLLRPPLQLCLLRKTQRFFDRLRLRLEAGVLCRLVLRLRLPRRRSRRLLLPVPPQRLLQQLLVGGVPFVVVVAARLLRHWRSARRRRWRRRRHRYIILWRNPQIALLQHPTRVFVCHEHRGHHRWGHSCGVLLAARVRHLLHTNAAVAADTAHRRRQVVVRQPCCVRRHRRRRVRRSRRLARGRLCRRSGCGRGGCGRGCGDACGGGSGRVLVVPLLLLLVDLEARLRRGGRRRLHVGHGGRLAADDGGGAVAFPVGEGCAVRRAQALHDDRVRGRAVCDGVEQRRQVRRLQREAAEELGEDEGRERVGSRPQLRRFVVAGGEGVQDLFGRLLSAHYLVDEILGVALQGVRLVEGVDFEGHVFQVGDGCRRLLALALALALAFILALAGFIGEGCVLLARLVKPRGLFLVGSSVLLGSSRRADVVRHAVDDAHLSSAHSQRTGCLCVCVCVCVCVPNEVQIL